MRRQHRGLSLLEVLVSLLILLIGVTSVIALFSVGIFRVRQAVLDTRTAIIADSMWDIVVLKEMVNDPLHRWPDVPAAENYLQPDFYPVVTPPVAQPLNHYTEIVAPDGDVTGGTPLSALADTGLPLLIDPFWVATEHDDSAITSLNTVGTLAERQAAIDYPAAAPFNDCFATFGAGSQAMPIRVVTTWEACSIADKAVRNMWIYRWFACGDFVSYRENVETPFSPSDGNINNPGSSYPLPLSEATASRTHDYHWALLMQRDVDADTSAGATNPTVGPPPLTNLRETALLVFYKRDLSQSHPSSPSRIAPYTLAVGRMENNDIPDPNPANPPIAYGIPSRIDLEYDPANKPRIRKGTWLCELSVEGPDAGQRRFFQFHRVADYEEIVDPNGTAPAPGLIIRCTLERPVSILEYTIGIPDDPRTGGYDPIPHRVPIVVFDGLQEVFNRDGLWP